MRSAGRYSYHRGMVLVLLVCTCGLTFLISCKTASQAAASAHQLNTVATTLAAYYDGLAAQLDDTVVLNQVQGAIYGISFSEQDRAQILAVREEIGKRAAMAHALADLATAFGNLAESKTGGDASSSASGLADELSKIKPLPQGPSISGAVGGATQVLIEFLKTHDLKKGAVSVSKAAAAVGEIFDNERRAYESINTQRLTLASAIANRLIDDKKIDINFAALVAPAVKPFSLTPKGEDMSANPAYAQLVKSEIEYQVQKQEREFGDSTSRLAASLHDTRDTINQVIHVK